MSWVVVFSAFWLGVLTSISPCPLASNIAAISFIGRQTGNDRGVLLSGGLYTLGRTLAYMVLGTVIVAGLLAGGEVSRFLQQYLNEALGPLLILLGMVLLGMIGGGLAVNFSGENIREKAEKNGVWFALPLGALFALSFCPVSAGLFFGALLPLSIKYSSFCLLPLVYGIGTAVPVIFFAFLIAFGGEYLGKAFHCLTQIELWIRRIAGIIFILAGIYYCLTCIYGIDLSF
ncbi:MAG: aromatic aminobenezylarsenical efflux permease ArsG family transporter [Victivallaceae bacterium]|nr:aromatic aminobenezylarsenical efflux permease ArsG family transporter [Victivallaceae bacterium]